MLKDSSLLFWRAFQPAMETSLAGLANRANRAVKRRGKYAFIAQLQPHSWLLDVGCGNNSPARFKSMRPDCHYIGIDVGDYKLKDRPTDYADEYVVVDPAGFADAIRCYEGQLDSVLSSHNIEHCDAPDGVMNAMLASLKPGGTLYLSFPCEESTHFPRRRGHLNFFDDPTHQAVPDWKATVSALKQAGMRIDFCAKRYRPLLLAALGFLLEPGSALLSRNGIAGYTWSLYGFESVIWASKPKTLPACGGKHRD